jgi:hypothetical protein
VSSNHSEDDDDRPRSNARWLVGALAVLTVALLVVWWPGCRQYPPVSSRESLGAMKLLYSACNTRDPARLDRVERTVQGLARDGKVTPAERESFERIVATARAGDWERAEDAAFKFAQDQVGAGSADHDPRDHADEPKPRAKPAKGR